MSARYVALASMLAATIACAGGEHQKHEEMAATPATARDITGGFATPESMLHDAAADVYLVSNINGQPLDKDDNGFISRVSPAGEVAALKWIDGAAAEVTLNAPKGLAIRHDTLFVTDIDVVRLFDRITGVALGEWPVAGATFLNDVAVGPDGTLYATDTGVSPGEGGFMPNGSDAVYRREGDRWTAVVSGQALGNPNGVFADSSGVTTVTFMSGEIYVVNPVTGERVMLPKPAAGGLDGVVKLSDGTLLIGSWGAKAVYRLSPTGEFTIFADSIDSPADIGLDATRGALLIPDFMHDRVLVRPIGR
jgi:hypothetical protein